MCIFCKIIKKEIESNIVYEDEMILAILDISQATKGHTLVIPKKHFENIFDIDENAYMHISKVVAIICKHYKDKLNITGINILNNSGVIAGQTVNHFHMHIIPRYEKNDLTMTFNSNSLDETLLEKIKL